MKSYFFLSVSLYLILLTTSHGQVKADSHTDQNYKPVQNSLSPDRSFSVSILEDLAGENRKLVLMSTERRNSLAELLLSNSSSSHVSASNTSVVLWNSESSAVAISFSDRLTSSILVCVKTPGQGFKWIDISSVEGPNLGALGRPKSDFVRLEHTPVRWIAARESFSRFISVRSRFWDKTGKRYTVEQKVAISPSGEFGWK